MGNKARNTIEKMIQKGYSFKFKKDSVEITKPILNDKKPNCN